MAPTNIQELATEIGK